MRTTETGHSSIQRLEVTDGAEDVADRSQAGENNEELENPPSIPEIEPTEAERWAVKYKGFSGPDMYYQRDILTNEVGTQVNRTASELFEAGIFEVIGVGEVPPPEAFHTGDKLVAFRHTADLSHQKVVLDERTYPELYALRREAQWLHYQGGLTIKAQGLTLLPPSHATSGSAFSSSQSVDDR